MSFLAAGRDKDMRDFCMTFLIRRTQGRVAANELKFGLDVACGVG
jgi:hypothetical protein